MQKNEWIERARHQLRALITEDLRNLDQSYRQIAIRRGCTEKLVADVAKEHGLARRVGTAGGGR